MPDHRIKRRSLLFGWFPFFHRPYVVLSGVQFHVLRRGHGPRRYLVIHGDEDTARDVLTEYMPNHMVNNGGIAYVVTGKTRNVDILGLKVDPNRMFSREGSERSLRDLNPGFDIERLVAALDFLDDKRENLLRHMIPPKHSRLFALHNNRDYSVRDELAASDQTSIRQPDQPRNFFLCTDPADFEILRQSPFNVVLQSKPDPDDGSMSRSRPAVASAMSIWSAPSERAKPSRSVCAGATNTCRRFSFFSPERAGFGVSFGVFWVHFRPAPCRKCHRYQRLHGFVSKEKSFPAPVAAVQTVTLLWLLLVRFGLLTNPGG